MRDELTTAPAQIETDRHIESDSPQAVSTASPSAAVPSAPAAPLQGQPGIVEEVLVEEVSIDGMCGVY